MFTDYKTWCIQRYGDPLFRIPVQIASSCPHGRCTFCAEHGAKAQQTQKQESPLEQIEEAVRFARRRYRAKKFMLYIQAFTTDLTDPEQQQTIYRCLDPFDFEAVSIGTRPDCLPPDALNFLEQLKTPAEDSGPTDKCRPDVPVQREVWVELGVQTTNDETLKAINRGHDWACSQNAILELADRGIHAAPHVIIGLPGESSADWNRTAEELAKLPVAGIKIHNLHIVKGTALAEQPPAAMNHREYAEALMDFLRRIPADIPVMRICTDTPDDERIAPHWPLEKGQFLDYVLQQMMMRELSQGDLHGRNGCPQPSADASERRPCPVVPTDDGSITFFSKDWKEHYHDKAGARLEAQKKYVDPSGLTEKLKKQDVQLLDVCFGLGHNSLAALCTADSAKYGLDITALEMDRRVVCAASQCFQPLETDPINWNETLKKLLDGSLELPNIGKIDLRFGDARYLIQHLKNKVYDLVFHDPFSTQRCPELWTVEFFQQLHRVMKPDGVLLTYSSAAPVRGAMLEAGFFIAETVPGHQMGNGTIASPSELPSVFPPPGKLDSRRAIPYRDEYLCATSRAILRERQEAVETIT